MDRRSATIAFFIGLVMFAAGYLVRDLFDASARPSGPRSIDLSMPASSVPGGAPAADPAIVRVRVGLDGQVSLEGGAEPPRALGRVTGVEDAEKRATLDACGAALAAATAAPASREADGTSRLALEVALDGGVPWIVSQWAMQLAASPAVRIRRVRFAPADGSAPVEVALPTDVDARTPIYRLPPSLTATVSLGREREGAEAPRIRIGARDHALASVAASGDPARDAEALASLDEPFRAIDAQLVDVHVASPSLTAEVAVPDGARVPTRVVLRLIRAYQLAGFPSLRFGGAALPKGPAAAAPR